MLENLDTNSIIKIKSDLVTGILTHKQFHNKKYYAIKTKNTDKVLELVLSWELYNMEVASVN